MNDTAKLLRESCRGCKYATESITIAMDYAKDKKIKNTLASYNSTHQAIKHKMQAKIHEAGLSEASHPSMPAAMAKLHMNLSLTLNPSDSKIADLMINGCSMGMKSISKLKNKHPKASPEAHVLADELILAEKNMISDMLHFLK
jgi:hypothetical protein